ncbi:hypothetical protein [Microbacterium sp. MMO-10]|uniref:hypothetical protein n=1 Tax=Microbacterium sp. MMO-10 TaxID=3081272 RepID=UPI0030185430
MKHMISALTALSFVYFLFAIAAIAWDFPFAAIAWTGLILICAWAWVSKRKGQHADRARVV